MKQTNRTTQSEGFRAHLYLTTRSKSNRGWQYVPHSKLTTVLAEEKPSWKTAQAAHESGHDAVLPNQLAFDFSLERVFRSLADRWREETQHMSNLIKASNHPAYQQIIGMGKAMPSVVVPLILEQLEHTPDHWFWALHEITNNDPAPQDADFEDARRAWLEWGKKNFHA